MFGTKTLALAFLSFAFVALGVSPTPPTPPRTGIHTETLISQ